jgi:hypothetical protein
MLNKPIEFIKISSSGKCTITEEAIEMLSKIESNLAVISIAGIYRSGKSYLLNRLLGRQDGFEIGPNISSCTKGIWIWGDTIKLNNKNTEVLIIDTEGLASAFEDRNENIDIIIFCLSVLLSSLFIYNSMKNIDESAIESLALVLNFAKKIQSKFNSLNDYANNFPSFLWVLRDFALELIDEKGKEISTKQYMENALKEENINNISNNEYNKNILEEINKKNEIRKIIKLFFKERDCYTLIRPVHDEKKLKIIDQIPQEQLRPEFLSQMNLLVQKIFDNIRPKNINGGYMNGPMFLNLAKMYINSLNSDELPNINTSWKIVIDSQLKSAYNTGLEYYINEMNNLDYKNYLTSEKIYKEHYDIKEKSLSYIMEYSNMNIPTNIFIDTYKNLEKKIDEEFMNNYYNKWENECKSQCENIYIKLIEEYKKSPELNEIFACLNTITEVLNFIDKSDTNEKKYEIMYPKIISFFIEFLKKEFKDNKMKNEQKMNELQQELIYNQDLLEKNKKIIEETRNNYEIQLKEIKEENLENRIDLESKIDEKEKIIQNIKTSNENKIEEMKLKIDELNSIILNYQNQEKEYSKDKKKKKKDTGIDETVLTFKLDAIANRIDSIQNLFFKNEVEKVKNKMLTEMDEKYEQVQKEFRQKLKTTKKNCEKALLTLKESKDTEIEKMKQIIKELNEEIQDYKSQVDSLEYKVSLYKEKIINYEKEKKANADHAELLRVLAGKLNGYIEKLSDKKKA